MKSRILATTALAGLVGAVLCPTAAIAAIHAPSIGGNYIGTSFEVQNNTSHTVTVQYDSDGSGHGAKAQFLNLDGSKVAEGTKPTLAPGQKAEFALEMYVDYQTAFFHQVDGDASADLYFLNTDGTQEGKTHIKGHNEASGIGRESWETWDTKFDGIKSTTESHEHEGGADVANEEGNFSWDLSAASEIDLN